MAGLDTNKGRPIMVDPLAIFIVVLIVSVAGGIKVSIGDINIGNKGGENKRNPKN